MLPAKIYPECISIDRQSPGFNRHSKTSLEKTFKRIEATNDYENEMQNFDLNSRPDNGAFFRKFSMRN